MKQAVCILAQVNDCEELYLGISRRAELCNEYFSPFADYNQRVFDVLSKAVA